MRLWIEIADGGHCWLLLRLILIGFSLCKQPNYVIKTKVCFRKKMKVKCILKLLMDELSCKSIIIFNFLNKKRILARV